MTATAATLMVGHLALALAFLLCGVLAALILDGLVEPYPGRHRAGSAWQVAGLVYWATLWLIVLELGWQW